jgi:aminopeptidase N
MMKLILCVCLTLVVTTVLNGQTNRSADPSPGVPRELARWRALHYSDVRYGMSVRLTPGAQMLQGSLGIRVTLDQSADIILDWRVNPLKEGQPKPRVWDITLNDKPASAAREVNEHLIIPGAAKGENIVHLKFESPIATSGSAVTRYLDREDSSEYIYTLFVPSDASTAFPCFDQPDLKARFTLDLNIPQAWNAVSNTAVSYGYPLPEATATDELSPGTRIAHFQPTEPISTYLFAFAAGPFVQIDELAAETARASAYPNKTSDPKKFVDDGIAPMHIYARRSKEKQAYKEAAEVFRLNRECLNYLAKYFDFKYPFPKYDLVIVPEFAYRGMEHAGATFLREESILFPSEPTANDFLSRANVVFHEAAHQWFGDLVTMRWFDDLWLKEGFAEFMSFKALEAIMPEFNAWKAFYERTKPAAYLTDATKGTTPIFQEIPNLSAAKSAYGNIVYRKAPSMLRQAEFYLGADKFQQALRLYLKEHAYANAEWSDLVRDFEKSSGQKLDAWADAWVRRRGMPEVDVRVLPVLPARDLLSAGLRQRNVLDEGGAWPMRLKVLMVFTDGTRETETATLGSDGEPPPGIQIYLSKPKRELAYVFANYEDYGYGRFLLDERSRAYVLQHLGEEKDDFLRALLWGSLWDSVREAELPPADYLELALKNLSGERDEVTAQGILNRVSIAFNAYLSKEQAREFAPRLERLLSDGMMKSDKQGLRITYFRAFQAMATTDEARATLKKILKGELSVPGLQLRTRDRFDIITALMARGDADAPALLAAESKTQTSDDAKRYAYAAGAALATPENKKRYFEAYLNDPQLAESWIEASVNPFNSIHQSALTFPYLEPALRELPKLKRTRKIFFVNGWLAAFIGGQCDERALKTVQDFLQREEKTLDRDLRLKVLEATDGLERCVRIRKEFQSPGSKFQVKN